MDEFADILKSLDGTSSSLSGKSHEDPEAVQKFTGELRHVQQYINDCIGILKTRRNKYIELLPDEYEHKKELKANYSLAGGSGKMKGGMILSASAATATAVTSPPKKQQTSPPKQQTSPPKQQQQTSPPGNNQQNALRPIAPGNEARVGNHLSGNASTSMVPPGRLPPNTYSEHPEPENPLDVITLYDTLISAYDMIGSLNDSIDHACINDLILMPYFVTYGTGSEEFDSVIDEAEEYEDHGTEIPFKEYMGGKLKGRAAKSKKVLKGGARNNRGLGFFFCCFRANHVDVYDPVMTFNTQYAVPDEDTQKNEELLKKFHVEFKKFHDIIEHIHDVERVLDAKAKVIQEKLLVVSPAVQQAVREFCDKAVTDTLSIGLNQPYDSPQNIQDITLDAYIVYLGTALSEIARHMNRYGVKIRNRLPPMPPKSTASAAVAQAATATASATVTQAATATLKAPVISISFGIPSSANGAKPPNGAAAAAAAPEFDNNVSVSIYNIGTDRPNYKVYIKAADKYYIFEDNDTFKNHLMGSLGGIEPDQLLIKVAIDKGIQAEATLKKLDGDPFMGFLNMVGKADKYQEVINAKQFNDFRYKNIYYRYDMVMPQGGKTKASVDVESVTNTVVYQEAVKTVDNPYYTGDIVSQLVMYPESITLK